MKPHRFYKRVQDRDIPKADVDHIIALTKVASKLMKCGHMVKIEQYNDADPCGHIDEWHILITYSGDTMMEDCIDDSV